MNLWLNLVKTVRFDQPLSLNEWLTHVIGTPKDLGCDVADHFASLFVLGVTKVSGGGLDVVVDGDTVEKHVLSSVNEEMNGVEEGITHFLKLCDVVARHDLLTVLHGGADLSEEFAKFVDTSGNLVEGAILKVSESGLQVGNKGADILDASFDVGDAFSFECAKDDTLDHFEHILSSALFNTGINIKGRPSFAPVSAALAIVFASIAPITSRPERAFFAATVERICYAASFSTPPGFCSNGKKGDSESGSHLIS